MKRERNYNNYSIKKKLMISHGIIVMLSVIITIVLLGGMINIKEKVDSLYEKPLKNIEAIGDVRHGIIDVLRAMDRIIAEDKRDSKEAYEIMKADVESDVEMILSATEVLKQNLMTDEGKELLDKIMVSIEDGESIRPQVMEALKDSSSEEAYEMYFNEYLPRVEGIEALSDQLEKQIRNTATEYYQSARSQSIFLIVIGVCLVAGGVIIAIIITARVTNSIVLPLKQLTDISKRLYK